MAYVEKCNVYDLVTGNVFRFRENSDVYQVIRFEDTGHCSIVYLTGDRAGTVVEVSANSVCERLLTYNGEPLKNIASMAQTSLDVQNACNLSGVVHSFSRILTHLREYLTVTGQPCGTDDVNRHPIVVLFVDKIADLTDRRENFSAAYGKVCELAAPTFLADSHNPSVE